MADTRGFVQTALATAHIPATERELNLLAGHLDMVVEANKAMNLTAVSDPERAAWIHIVDSLLALPFVVSAPAGPLCDLGSGAGYPAIPLCVASSRHTVLVEATGKKAAFLRRVIEQLALDADVMAARAEEAAATRRGEFAVVTARALSSLPSLLELATPFLLVGGRCIAFKGAPEPAEMARGDRAAKLLGLRKIEQQRLVLEGADSAERTLLVYERVREPRVALPRRDGLAQHSPLA